MGKRIRKHRQLTKIDYKDSIPVIPPTKISLKTKSNIFLLGKSGEDRIKYIYEVDNKNRCVNVVNVCFDILIDGNWTTVRRYDSEHGVLRFHQRKSLNSDEVFVVTADVKKRKTAKHWLTYAVEDLKKNYLNYKAIFLNDA